jgi:hypothetical protein
MRLLPSLALILSLVAGGCSLPSAAEEPGSAPATPEATTAAAPGVQAFGAALATSTVTPLADILANPARYQGQVVRTSAPIQAICQHRGCWMDIGSANEADGRMHVRSLDHAFSFPRDAVGKTAEVEGEVQAMPGVSECGSERAEVSPNMPDDPGAAPCGVVAAGRRVQLAVRGAVIR